MNNKLTSLLVISILLLVAATVAVNYSKYFSVDRTKIPEKVELHYNFQRWITNLKNSGFDINADEFRLKEKNEVYNSATMQIYSSDDKEQAEKLNQFITKSIEEYVEKDIRDIAVSPNKKQILDTRSIERDGYLPNEVHYYGFRDEKILDSKLLTCNELANCYFDRGFFLDNHVLVISEISRNFEKYDENVELCEIDEVCTYTVKLHVIDLNQNSRLVYESRPFDLNLQEIIPEL